MYQRSSAPMALRTGNVARDLVHQGSFPILLFLLAHIPLALLMRQVPIVSTLHALGTIAIGLLWSLMSPRPMRTASVLAYIAGAEVLWRMTGAQIFWEAGKYATVLLVVVAVLRIRQAFPPLLALGYFLLLLPSVALTFASMSVDRTRDQVSFNLSGPLALLAVAWYFSHLHLSREQLLRIMLTAVSAVIGIATLALYNTLTAERLVFTDESNFVTSGGFGPNQVSAMLGLGALLCLLPLLTGVSHAALRLPLLVTMLSFTTLSILTLSRGGIYAAGGAAAACLLYVVRDVRGRVGSLLVVAVLALAANYIIIPRLDAFTGGALTQRYQNTGTSGRDRLMVVDVALFREHPLLGVGPGGARNYHAQAYFGGAFAGQSVAAHSELTRMLAEHGVFGLGSLLLLGMMMVHNIRRQPSVQGKALVLALVVWSLLYMFTGAMRIVAPSFAIGLSFALFTLRDE